jgi:hypothetical protein
MATEGGNRVRASDAEREEYAKMLRAAMTEGRLTLEEGEERLSKVYAATFRDELPHLTADLPDGGRRALYDNPEARAEFEKRARKYVAGHAGFTAVLAGALVGLWAISHSHFFWPAIPLLILTFSLMRRVRWARWAASGAAAGGRPGGPWHHHGHHGRFQGPWGVAPWNRPEDWRR